MLYLDCPHDPVRLTEHLRGTRESEPKKQKPRLFFATPCTDQHVRPLGTDEAPATPAHLSLNPPPPPKKNNSDHDGLWLCHDSTPQYGAALRTGVSSFLCRV